MGNTLTAGPAARDPPADPAASISRATSSAINAAAAARNPRDEYARLTSRIEHIVAKSCPDRYAEPRDRPYDRPPVISSTYRPAAEVIWFCGQNCVLVLRAP